MFTDDADVAEIVSDCLLIVCCFQVFDAMNITYLHALLGIGDSLCPAVVTAVLFTSILCGGGLAMVSVFPQLQSLGVWVVIAIYNSHQGLMFRFLWNSPTRLDRVLRRHCEKGDRTC